MIEKQSLSEQIFSNLIRSQFSEALTKLKSFNNEQLALFQLHYPQVHPMLSKGEFQSFWEDRRKALRLPSDPEFRFVKQPDVSDADWVSGYLLYLLDLKLNRDQKAGKTVSEKPKKMDYGSFFLVRQRLHDLFPTLEEGNEDKLNRFVEILYHLESFAKRQGCPGYLLLANGYLQLAKKRDHQSAQQLEAFKMAWQMLCMAELSETDSEASIHNAYFGKGLRLSNPALLSTFHEMKEAFRTAAGDLLPLSSQVGAEEAAKRAYPTQGHNEGSSPPAISPRMH